MNNLPLDPRILVEIANTPMPYGKYQGRLLLDLPEPYVVWLTHNALPSGKLGDQLKLLYEIKVNGMEPLLAPLRHKGTST